MVFGIHRIGGLWAPEMVWRVC